jgi:polysaccharide export outer membrane protein
MFVKSKTAARCLAAALAIPLLLVPAAAPSAAGQTRIQAPAPVSPSPARTSSPGSTPAPEAPGGDDRQLPPAVPQTGDYRLGPGDKLRIEVYRNEQLSQNVQVRPDGKITLPLIDEIAVTGMTPLDLREKLVAAWKEFVTNPVVSVVVVEALASQVFVMGEVNKVGAVPLNGPTTILQALALAGGFREFANTKDVRVMRQTSTGVQTLRFNYNDAVNGQVKPFYLRAGDTVIVR